MNVILLKRSDDDSAPGPWWRPLQKGNQLSAWVRCPQGHSMTLLEHEIATDGEVNPGIRCPKECGFEGFAVLDGWEALSGGNLPGSWRDR